VTRPRASSPRESSDGTTLSGPARTPPPPSRSSPHPPTKASEPFRPPLRHPSTLEAALDAGSPTSDAPHLLPSGSDLFGVGEAAGPLRRNGRRITLWNADHYAYDETTASLYQSHPWVLGIRPDGSAFGILWDTTGRSRVWLGDGVLAVRAEDAGFAAYTIEGQTPEIVLTRLTELIGRAPLPPLWALGFHQSRYSYYPDSEVRRIADEMRTRRIPCDVIWLDIHYMDGNRSFTFDPSRFSDPAALLAHLRARDFRSVLMIDPGLKFDPAYHAYASGRDAGAFVRDEVGREYLGEVWPGACAFPDFSNAAVRHWWGDLYRPLIELGADGFWNDMNEPAIFDGPDRTMPESNIHLADPELGGPTTHARIHNIYGTLMVRATREGVARHRPERRPFLLTRANFLGGHRYAATWTGDNSSTWDHLAWSITMALNLGLSGQPMVGPDIGGFEGNASGTLFARWMGIGAMLPFCRAHTDVWTREHEPWSWGPDIESTCRRAIIRRYRLLPYWYTLFWEASRTGLPPVRPLFFLDPSDSALRAADDAFTLGDAIMVRCRVSETGACLAPMPRGSWRRFELTELPDPELPELWLRPGHIVPIGPALQHTAERPLDPLTLLIALDTSGNASGTLYEDAGDGHEHTSGAFRLTRYAAERKARHVSVSVASTEGDRPRCDRAIRVELLHAGGIAVATGRDGDVLTFDLPE
jgi:alpha-glucosidase